MTSMHVCNYKYLLVAVIYVAIYTSYAIEIDDEIQSKHFSNDVLASMAKHWFDFGLKLGIDEIYLNNIMPTTTKKFFTNMLQKWWHRTDAVARTWNKVVSALDAVKLSGLAKRVYDRRIKQADNFVDDDM